MDNFKDELKKILVDQQTEEEDNDAMLFAQKLVELNCRQIQSGLLAAAKNKKSNREIKYESTIASICLDQIDKDHIPPKTGQFCAFEDNSTVHNMSEQKNGCIVYDLSIITDIRSLVEKNANIIVKGDLTEAGSYLLNEIQSRMKKDDIQIEYFIRYTYSSFGKNYTDEVLSDYQKFSMYFLRKTVDVHLCCRANII